MPRPAFEIFRVIHSLSLSRPASSSLRRPRCLSPLLHTRRPNRSCRVTPRLHLSGPVGAIFLATRTFSSFCAVLRQARLTLLARTNKANFWILGRTQEDICGLGVDRQVCSGELLSTYPMATQLKVSNLASFECRKCSPHRQGQASIFPTPNFIGSSGVPRKSECINNMPATCSAPRNLDTVVAQSAIVHATPTSVHHTTPKVKPAATAIGSQRPRQPGPVGGIPSSAGETSSLSGSYLSNAPGVMDLNSFKIASP